MDGKVVVSIEPTYASLVNLSADYHVYVTALCDEAVLLYVSEKGATSFTVKGVSMDGKASQCGFEYRIVAQPIASDGTRLATITIPETTAAEPDTTQPPQPPAPGVDKP